MSSINRLPASFLFFLTSNSGIISYEQKRKRHFTDEYIKIKLSEYLKTSHIIYFLFLIYAGF